MSEEKFNSGKAEHHEFVENEELDKKDEEKEVGEPSPPVQSTPRPWRSETVMKMKLEGYSSSDSPTPCITEAILTLDTENERGQMSEEKSNSGNYEHRELEKEDLPKKEEEVDKNEEEKEVGEPSPPVRSTPLPWRSQTVMKMKLEESSGRKNYEVEEPSWRKKDEGSSVGHSSRSPWLSRPLKKKQLEEGSSFSSPPRRKEQPEWVENDSEPLDDSELWDGCEVILHTDDMRPVFRRHLSREEITSDLENNLKVIGDRIKELELGHDYLSVWEGIVAGEIKFGRISQDLSNASVVDLPRLKSLCHLLSEFYNIEMARIRSGESSSASPPASREELLSILTENIEALRTRINELEFGEGYMSLWDDIVAGKIDFARISSDDLNNASRRDLQGFKSLFGLLSEFQRNGVSPVVNWDGATASQAYFLVTLVTALYLSIVTRKFT